jgi:SAM-dependent methyltransferase
MSAGAIGAPDPVGPQDTSRERVHARLTEHLAGNKTQRHTVYICAKLGIAGLLAAGARSSDELAASLGAHADTLLRLLRGMVSIGLLTQEEDGRFALAEMGQLLRSDASEPYGGLRGRIIKSAELDYAWSGLLHTVMTGEPAFRHVFGEGPFPHFAGEPAVAALGAQLNPGTSWDVAQAIAAAYDFGRFEKVVDVGGGNGIVLAAILQRYPQLTGAVLDQPHLMEDVRQVAAQYGVAGRLEPVPGDFFQSVPKGDVYVLKTILHDWDDDDARRILERCREAMRPGGRALAVESVLPERAVEGVGHFDIVMLVETGGRERTESQFRQLYADAGLTLTEIRPLQAGRYVGRSLIEGAPGDAERTVIVATTAAAT